MNPKLRAMSLTAEGRLDEAQRAWLAATLDEVARLIVEPFERGFAEALGCLIAARRPLLSKARVLRQVNALLKGQPHTPPRDGAVPGKRPKGARSVKKTSRG